MIIKLFWNYPKYFDQPKDFFDRSFYFGTYTKIVLDFFGVLFYFSADTQIFLALARFVLEDILFWHRYKNIFSFGKIGFGRYFILAKIQKYFSFWQD